MERELRAAKPEPTVGSKAESSDPSSGDIVEKGQGDSLAPEFEYPEGGARAWHVASGTALIMFSTLGYVNSWGVYQAYYETHQLRGHTADSISWIGSLQAFFIFAGGIIGGPMFDRWGAKVIRPAAFAYVFSIMMTSISKVYWHFMLAQGVLGGLSIGLTMCPAMAATPQYFNKKRGGAMGLALAGSCIGGVIWPIALGKMLNSTSSLSFGWAIRIVGFVLLAVLGYAAFAIKARLPPRKSDFFLPGALKDKVYVLVVCSAFFLFMGMFTPFFFLPVYAEFKGMNPTLAAYLLAILNGSSLPGRVLPGILADKFGRFNMLFGSALSSGVITLCWTKCQSSAAIIVFAVFFGCCSGALVSGISVSLATCATDPKNIGTLLGMGLFFSSFASLIGPPINGALVSNYHGYLEVSILSGVCLLFGGGLVLLAKYVSGKGLLARL